MSRKAGGNSWRPLIAVLGLFVISLLAPLAWYQHRKPQRNAGLDLPPAPPATSEVPLFPIHRVSRVTEPQYTSTPVVVVHRAAQVAPHDLLAAENLELEPAAKETPTLPVAEPEVPDRLSLRPEALQLDPASPSEKSQATESLVDSLTSPPGKLLPPAVAPSGTIPPALAWPVPVALIEQLDELAAGSPQFAPWAGQVRVQAERLASIHSLNDPQAAAILARFHELAVQARTIAQSLPDDQHRSRLLRAGYAIVRRLAVWQEVHELSGQAVPRELPAGGQESLTGVLEQIHQRLPTTGTQAVWRKYLLIDEARERFDSSACTPGDQRKLARDMLHRLNSTQLNGPQQRFLQTALYVELERELYERAAEVPDYVALLSAVEAYEHDGLAGEAAALAEAHDCLRWSSDPEILELAEAVDSYYRNANVRVALSADLINRLLPQQASMNETVRDMILGAQVEGGSQTSTRLHVVLVPDAAKWSFGLEAQGSVRSETASSKGPATFYQNGQSFFRARKRVQVDRRGIRLFNSEAAADANSSLSDYETDFDGIPFLGNFARAIARNQYDSQKHLAKAEVEGRIVDRASSQLDREVAAKIEKAKLQFQNRLLTPFQKLSLEPTAVDMQTTKDRLIARYRLAGRDQVSAHTPRPQAPADSLLSAQIHQTAINNVFDNLQLQGREIDLADLYKEITGRFLQKAAPLPEDLPENVQVTFADADPVRIDCQDGRMRLTIRLRELTHGKKQKWTNFAVRGYYVPSTDGIEASLAREGVIELIGERLRFGDQIALRGIFSAVLSKNRKLNLTTEQIAKAPELKDLQVTQFVVHDGWIGIAVGPKHPGRHIALQPRLDQETREE